METDNQSMSATEKLWEKFLESDLPIRLEEYQSIIPSNIISRPDSLLKYLCVVGIERMDLPKLPNGEHSKWWYIIQFKSCRSCVFFSHKIKDFPNRKCHNPKIHDRQFEIFSKSLNPCPFWSAGFDEKRIDQDKDQGFMENHYVLAAFIQMGLMQKPKEIVIPLIGTAEMYCFTPEIAQAADIHNYMMFSYLQMHFLMKAGQDVEKEDMELINFDELPVIKAQKFDTNVLL